MISKSPYVSTARLAALAVATHAGLCVGTAQAENTISLDLTAADGSRWYDYFSDAFGELGQQHTSFFDDDNDPGTPDVFGVTPPVPTESVPGTNDGFFQITNPSNLFGAANIFVNDNDFSDSYTLTFDDSIPVTGAGTEVRDVTALDFDFDADVADGDFVTNMGYDTAISNINGTITFVDGAVDSFDVTADIAFTYVGGFGGGDFVFTGDLVLSGNEWDVLVNVPLLPSGELDLTGAQDLINLGFAAPQAGWDLNGTLSSSFVIPEPGSLALIGLGAATFLGRRRKPDA
ncbi:MAG: PEP-CTERM sorting domain-containing protein [Planctomycetota bacterium]